MFLEFNEITNEEGGYSTFKGLPPLVEYFFSQNEDKNEIRIVQIKSLKSDTVLTLRWIIGNLSMYLFLFQKIQDID